MKEKKKIEEKDEKHIKTDLKYESQVKGKLSAVKESRFERKETVDMTIL